jgi:predicted secreted protein
MTLPVSIGVYFICWWLVLFAILPIGVRTPGEGDDVPEGSADSAPVEPYILRKFLAATLISAVVFAMVYAAIAYHLIPFEALPGGL